MLKRFFLWLVGLFDKGVDNRASPSASKGGDSGPRYVARAEQDPLARAKAGILHLVEDGQGSYWLGILRCPCGCGATIQLPMTPSARPCWQLQGSMLQPTLWPSIRRASGCKSHFVLRQGAVQWCRDL